VHLKDFVLFKVFTTVSPDTRNATEMQIARLLR